MAEKSVGRLFRCALVLLWLACGAPCDTGSTTQGLAVTLAPNAKLSVPPMMSLVAAGATFLPFTGTLPVSYRARTSPGGGGKITLQLTSDFSAQPGPSAASGALTYTCGGASLGAPCSGTQVASPTFQTPVLDLPRSACTGGGNGCSALDPNVVQLQFTLENNSAYPTGTYSAQVTLVISAI